MDDLLVLGVKPTLTSTVVRLFTTLSYPLALALHVTLNTAEDV